jgi:hypothetical protein
MSLFSEKVEEKIREAHFAPPIAVGTIEKGGGFMGFYEMFLRGQGPKRFFVPKIYIERADAKEAARQAAILFLQNN